MYHDIPSLTEVDLRGLPYPTVDGVRLSMAIRPKFLTPELNRHLADLVELIQKRNKGEIINEVKLKATMKRVIKARRYHA